jgi:hypothetical protein
LELELTLRDRMANRRRPYSLLERRRSALDRRAAGAGAQYARPRSSGSCRQGAGGELENAYAQARRGRHEFRRGRRRPAAQPTRPICLDRLSTPASRACLKVSVGGRRDNAAAQLCWRYLKPRSEQPPSGKLVFHGGERRRAGVRAPDAPVIPNGSGAPCAPRDFRPLARRPRTCRRRAWYAHNSGSPHSGRRAKGC